MIRDQLLATRAEARIQMLTTPHQSPVATFQRKKVPRRVLVVTGVGQSGEDILGHHLLDPLLDDHSQRATRNDPNADRAL